MQKKSAMGKPLEFPWGGGGESTVLNNSNQIN